MLDTQMLLQFTELLAVSYSKFATTAVFGCSCDRQRAKHIASHCRRSYKGVSLLLGSTRVYACVWAPLETLL